MTAQYLSYTNYMQISAPVRFTGLVGELGGHQEWRKLVTLLEQSESRSSCFSVEKACHNEGSHLVLSYYSHYKLSLID